MSEPFRGTALPLDQEGLAEVIDRMGVGAAELWAVLDIETRGLLPDLVVRTAQIYLVYLGYHPGPIDGVIGRFTRSALHEFQGQHGLPVTSEIDEGQLSTLKREVEKLEP